MDGRTGSASHIALVEVAPALDGCSPADDAVLDRATVWPRGIRVQADRRGGGGRGGKVTDDDPIVRAHGPLLVIFVRALVITCLS